MENVNDERRQLLEEGVELDQIWGIWEGEEQPTRASQLDQATISKRE